MSAVEARKLVPKHWSKLDNKPELRNALLQASLNEENKLVRHSGSRVVSSIAKVDFENSEWQDLPGLLLQACTSPQVRQREVGMYMIYTLMETMGDFFTENLPSLFQLFANTIQDPESAEVRVNTMLTLSRVAMLVDGEDDPDSVKAFQELVPHMVNVLKATVVSQLKPVQHFQLKIDIDKLLNCQKFIHIDLELSVSKFNGIIEITNPSARTQETRATP